LDTNDQTCSWGTLTATGSTTRALDLGTSTVTLTTTSGTVWDPTGTNVTPTFSGATIILDAVSNVTARAFKLQSTTYGAIEVKANPAGGVVTFDNTGATITTFRMNTGFAIANFGSGTTTTINNFDVEGSGNTAVQIAVGGALTGTANITVGGLNFNGSGTITASNSFNLGNVTGVTVSGPATGGGAGVIG
jgi:hypothetical protein